MTVAIVAIDFTGAHRAPLQEIRKKRRKAGSVHYFAPG
jgi:hypothetical protein